MISFYCWPVPFMLFSFSIVASSALPQPLENVAVVRYIDISTQLVMVNCQIKVRNNNTYPLDNYIYFVDPEWVEDLAYVGVFDKKKNQLPAQRSTTELTQTGETVLKYTILLSHPLSHGETTDFTVLLIVTNRLKSYPKRVKQYEKHMVLFSFNVFHYSGYFSHLQTTYLYMGTTKAALIDGAEYKFANDSKYGLQYGPFHDIEPYKAYQSVFHYENNSPFLVVEKIKRFIKISQWGFVSIWDQIQLRHSGPKFEGPFKRVWDNYKKNAPKDTRIEGFDSTLPTSAFDIYLKDDIGMIWSYKVDYDDVHGVQVAVVPRNILYGGWKTEYEIGYSLPMREFATRRYDEYILSFPLVDKIFENMVIKEAEINVILPEGAIFRSLDPQFEIENKTDSKFCYYFDTTCREVITFRRYNLVERNIDDILIRYSYSQINLLIKPFTIAILIYVILIFMKICSNSSFFDSSCSSPQQEKKVKQIPLKEHSVTSTVKTKNKKNSKQKQ